MIESKNGLEITQVMALFFFFFFRAWTCSPPAHETWEPPFTLTGKDLLHSHRSTADLTPSQKENPTHWEKQQAKKTNITKFQEGQLVLLLLLGKNKLWEIHIAKPVVAFMHAGPWIFFFSSLHTVLLLLLLLLLLQSKKKGVESSQQSWKNWSWHKEPTMMMPPQSAAVNLWNSKTSWAAASRNE